MGVPRQHQLAWKVTLSVIHSLALLWTAFRLYRRLKTRLWWDDAAIAVVVLADACYFAKIYIVLVTQTSPKAISGPSTNFFLSQWFGGLLYTTVLWFSRISLMLTIARVFSGQPRIHKVAISLAGCLFSFYAAINVSSAFNCERMDGAPWYVLDIHKCVVVTGAGDTLAAILGLLLSFLADTIFIAYSLILFKTMSMRRRTSLLLAIFFCGGFIALGWSITFTSIYYSNKSHPDIMMIFYAMAHLQATGNLMISNLVVELLIYFRFFHETTGLSTFSDGVDASEARRDRRANRDDSSTRNSESIERITLTPISTAMQTDSNISEPQSVKEAEV